MGRKTRNCDRDFNQLQKLKKENKDLKRQIAKLRKQVDRLNINHDRYRTLRELVHKQTQEERARKKAGKDWTCYKCGKGKLRIVIIPMRNMTKYFRKCNICTHRTKTKKYTDEVEDS